MFYCIQSTYSALGIYFLCNSSIAFSTSSRCSRCFASFSRTGRRDWRQQSLFLLTSSVVRTGFQLLLLLLANKLILVCLMSKGKVMRGPLCFSRTSATHLFSLLEATGLASTIGLGKFTIWLLCVTPHADHDGWLGDSSMSECWDRSA